MGETMRRALPGEAVEAFIDRYLKEFRHCKTYWNYEDGCVLKGCADLYRATGRAKYRDFVLQYLEECVSPAGQILTFPLDKYNIDSINCGKALFFALDETGDERYRKAADFLHERLKTHPRCACGNFWHKEIYPDQIWLDGLYMAQPFLVEYDMRFGGRQAARDVAGQFQNVRKYLYDDASGLYYHGCDMARRQPWADPETGCSRSFWLRAMGWYMMALVDCADKMDEQLYEHYRTLIDLLAEAARGVFAHRDAETGLYYQVMDLPGAPGNYLETSGSAMMAYTLLKGVRLGLLDGEKYLDEAQRAFCNLAALKLHQDAAGAWHLGDICLVAGLGPGEKRDGSAAYYFSEPKGDDDHKGVGAFLMALAEYERSEKA